MIEGLKEEELTRQEQRLVSPSNSQAKELYEGGVFLRGSL